MNNSNSTEFESYSLPPGYIVRQEKAKDTLKLFEYEFSSNKRLISSFFIALFPISILSMIPAGYASWKALHRSLVFDGGIEQLDFPDFGGWVYILYKASLFGLTIPLIALISYYVTYLSFALFCKLQSNPEKNISNNWVAKYENRIVGQAKFDVDKNYSRLMCISIHPRHQNLGLGSCLLNTAIQNTRRPVYLLCFPRLQSFYRRLGFARLPWRQIPWKLKPVPGIKVMKLS